MILPLAGNSGLPEQCFTEWLIVVHSV